MCREQRPHGSAALAGAGAVGIVLREGDGWLVSSVAGRKILRVSDTGEARPFLTPDAETGGLFGMVLLYYFVRAALKVEPIRG